MVTSLSTKNKWIGQTKLVFFSIEVIVWFAKFSQFQEYHTKSKKIQIWKITQTNKRSNSHKGGHSTNHRLTQKNLSAQTCVFTKISHSLHRFMFFIDTYVYFWLLAEVARQSYWPNLGRCSKGLRNISLIFFTYTPCILIPLIFYSPTDAQLYCIKNITFTLKLTLNGSNVFRCNHHHQGAHYSILLKLLLLK
jgi:hypothetical protein